MATTERRLVTVLFADLTGYTSFAEGRDSEDTRKFLSSYFEKSKEIVERFGGLVEKFIGDAVMAVWGAEVAHEDDAERAIRAGFELTDLVAKLAKDEDAPNLALRVGVNTGEAAVGPGQDHMGFVTGDLVNTASRLESAARPGSVLVGEVTRDAAQNAIAFEDSGSQTLKGKSHQVSTFTALRVISELGGRGRSEALDPPFVGRNDELRLLKDLLATVGREKRSRLVSVIGEAGIGKSRLLWEFQKYSDGLVENTYWHEGRSPSYGDGVTYWAVSEMIRRRAGIAEYESDAEATEKLDQTLEFFVSDPTERNWIRPRVLAVIGIGEAPPGGRDELDAAIRSFFEHVSDHGTAVLVFEDLHWADPALLDFVESLTEWWQDRPILVITLARPDLLERRANWGTARQRFFASTLGVLDARDMAKLVSGTVVGVPDEAVSLIVARAAGVPLYAVELLRSLLASGDLEQQADGYRLVGDVSDLAVPKTLQAVIGARLDRLEPADRALLQDAAVLGHAFSLDALSVITGEPLGSLEGRLSDLVRNELVQSIRDSRSPDTGQYRFIQGLIRDVAIGRMSKESRRSRHLAVAEHMEEQNDPEIAVVVASHYLQALEATGPGEERERIHLRALGSLDAAAKRAADLSSWEQVSSIAETALSLGETDDQRAGFWEQLLQSYTYQSEADLGEKYGLMALQLHRDRGNKPGEWQVMAGLGSLYVNLGRRDKAVDLLADLVEANEELDSDPSLARAAVIYSRASMLQGLPRPPALDAGIAAAERWGLKAEVADGLITKGSYADIEARLLEARILYEGAIQYALEHDLKFEATRGLNNLAFSYSAIDIEVANEALAQALELSRKTGARAAIQWHLGQTAIAAALNGSRAEFDKDAADPIFHNADPIVLGNLRFGESVLLTMEGKLDDAQAALNDTSELAADGDPQALESIKGARFFLQCLTKPDMDSQAFLASFAEADSWWKLSSYAAFLLWRAAVSTEPDEVKSILKLFEPFPNQFPDERSLLQAMLDLDAGDDHAIAVVDRLADRYREHGGPFQVSLILRSAGTWLPDGHARKQEYLEQAHRVADEAGLVGIRDA